MPDLAEADESGNEGGPSPTVPGTLPRIVLAFDFGRRRIGVACGDTVSRSARALTAIANFDSGPEWRGVDSVLRAWQPALVVVGLPYNADGTQSPMSRAAGSFARDVEARYALPVHRVDERYSSLEAEARLKALRESGAMKRKIARTDIDAVAACIILERWFLAAH